MANSIAANSIHTNAFAPATFNPSTSAKRAQPYRRNLFERVVGSLIAMRQRQADAEIARYIASTGGKLTDQVEREIARRMN